jgi:hypothetical protein
MKNTHIMSINNTVIFQCAYRFYASYILITYYKIRAAFSPSTKLISRETTKAFQLQRFDQRRHSLWVLSLSAIRQRNASFRAHMQRERERESWKIKTPRADFGWQRANIVAGRYGPRLEVGAGAGERGTCQGGGRRTGGRRAAISCGRTS